MFTKLNTPNIFYTSWLFSTQNMMSFYIWKVSGVKWNSHKAMTSGTLICQFEDTQRVNPSWLAYWNNMIKFLSLSVLKNTDRLKFAKKYRKISLHHVIILCYRLESWCSLCYIAVFHSCCSKLNWTG